MVEYDENGTEITPEYKAELERRAASKPPAPPEKTYEIETKNVNVQNANQGVFHKIITGLGRGRHENRERELKHVTNIKDAEKFREEYTKAHPNAQFRNLNNPEAPTSNPVGSSFGTGFFFTANPSSTKEKSGVTFIDPYDRKIQEYKDLEAKKAEAQAKFDKRQAAQYKVYGGRLGGVKNTFSQFGRPGRVIAAEEAKKAQYEKIRAEQEVAAQTYVAKSEARKYYRAQFKPTYQRQIKYRYASPVQKAQLGIQGFFSIRPSKKAIEVAGTRPQQVSRTQFKRSSQHVSLNLGRASQSTNTHPTHIGILNLGFSNFPKSRGIPPRSSGIKTRFLAVPKTQRVRSPLPGVTPHSDYLKGNRNVSFIPHSNYNKSKTEFKGTRIKDFLRF